MTNYPKGNGFFIWYLKRVEGGDPVAAAKVAKESGVSWVAIKIANGVAPFNLRQTLTGYVDDLIQPFVDAFHAQGVAVYGWHYIYGYSPIVEANIAVERVKKFGLDGYIADPEAEYKIKGRVVAGTAFMQQFRRIGSGIPIGLCTYRYPVLHPEFPWSAFKGVDFVAPQVYWMGAHNPGYQLARTKREYDALFPGVPFIPIGATFSEHGWTPTVSDIAEFAETSEKMQVPGMGWWAWYWGREHPDWWQAATGNTHNYVEDAAAPIIAVKASLYSVVTSYTSLRIRTAPSLTGAISGYMVKNMRYEIDEEVAGWGRLHGTDVQWTCLAYTYKV